MWHLIMPGMLTLEQTGIPAFFMPAGHTDEACIPPEHTPQKLHMPDNECAIVDFYAIKHIFTATFCWLEIYVPIYADDKRLFNFFKT